MQLLSDNGSSFSTEHRVGRREISCRKAELAARGWEVRHPELPEGAASLSPAGLLARDTTQAWLSLAPWAVPAAAGVCVLLYLLFTRGLSFKWRQIDFTP